MEVGLVGSTLYIRFDGKYVAVTDPVHVAAFRALLQHPDVAALLAPADQVPSEDEEDPDGETV